MREHEHVAAAGRAQLVARATRPAPGASTPPEPCTRSIVSSTIAAHARPDVEAVAQLRALSRPRGSPPAGAIPPSAAGISRRDGSGGVCTVRPGSPPASSVATCCRAVAAASRGSVKPRGSCTTRREPVATASIAGVGGHLALSQHVVVAEHRSTRARRGPATGSGARPRRAARVARARRRPGGSRAGPGSTSDCTPRSRARRCSGPTVAAARAPPAPASARSAASLSIMSPVTITACGFSASIARTVAASTCGESASCGRNVELNGGAEAVEERDPRGRLLVAHVRVRELGERRELLDRARRAARDRCGPRTARPVRARGSRRRAGRPGGRQRRAAAVARADARSAPAQPASAPAARSDDQEPPHRSVLPQPGHHRLALEAARRPCAASSAERQQPADDDRRPARRRRPAAATRSPPRAWTRPDRARAAPAPRPRAPRPRPPAARRRPARAAPRARRARRRAAARPRRAARAPSAPAPARARTGRRARPPAPTPRSTAASTPRSAWLRGRPGHHAAARAPSSASRRCRPPPVRARRAAARRSTAPIVGSAAEQPVRLRVGHAAVVLERAHERRPRGSAPRGRWAARTASVAPGRSPSASATPVPTSASPGPRTRRPSASGGASKRVWSPG